jgi:hypothetical protein
VWPPPCDRAERLEACSRQTRCHEESDMAEPTNDLEHRVTTLPPSHPTQGGLPDTSVRLWNSGASRQLRKPVRPLSPTTARRAVTQAARANRLCVTGAVSAASDGGLGSVGFGCVTHGAALTRAVKTARPEEIAGGFDHHPCSPSGRVVELTRGPVNMSASPSGRSAGLASPPEPYGRPGVCFGWAN